MKLRFLFAAVLVQGCTVTPNQITGVEFGGMSRRPNAICDSDVVSTRQQCTAALLESLKFAEIGKTIVAAPEGQGTCGFATVEFGDGNGVSSFTNQVVDHRGSWQVPHTYSGWPGKKTVRIKGISGCYGDITRDISVGFGADGRESVRTAYSPSTTRACDEVRHIGGQLMPILRAGTGIRIETDGRTFNYGASNQTFDASGDRTTLAPPGYPFPGLRKFGLVYRVGTQVVQGEADHVTFVTRQNGFLEICTNDNPSYLMDNTGIMLLTITVNERSGATP